MERGRPRTFDENRVLVAAMHTFWEHGYETTSVADLTHATKVRHSSLYQAFGSKRDLYLAALECYQATYGNFVAVGLEEPTARAAVETILAAAANTFANPDRPRGCMVILSAINGSADSAGIAEEVRSIRLGALRSVEERLRKAIADGDLDPASDPSELAAFVMTVLQGMAVMARDGADTATLRAVARRTMDGWPR